MRASCRLSIDATTPSILAGAPQVMGAGVDLLCKVGAAVRAGQPLYRLHAQYAADLDFSRNLAARDSGYIVDGAAVDNCAARVTHTSQATVIDHQ